MSLGRTFASNPGVTGPEPVPGQYGVSEIVLRGWICPLLVPDFLPPCLAAGLIGHRASKVDLRPDVGDVPTCEIGELLGTPHRSVSARTDTAPVSLTLLKRAVLEGVHVGREARFCLLILPFRFFPCGKIHFPIALCLWQSSGKAEKFNCDFLRLDAL